MYFILTFIRLYTFVYASLNLFYYTPNICTRKGNFHKIDGFHLFFKAHSIFRINAYYFHIDYVKLSLFYVYNPIIFIHFIVHFSQVSNRNPHDFSPDTRFSIACVL